MGPYLKSSFSSCDLESDDYDDYEQECKLVGVSGATTRQSSALLYAALECSHSTRFSFRFFLSFVFGASGGQVRDGIESPGEEEIEYPEEAQRFRLRIVVG